MLVPAMTTALNAKLGCAKQEHTGGPEVVEWVGSR